MHTCLPVKCDAGDVSHKHLQRSTAAAGDSGSCINSMNPPVHCHAIKPLPLSFNGFPIKRAHLPAALITPRETCSSSCSIIFFVSLLLVDLPAACGASAGPQIHAVSNVLARHGHQPEGVSTCADADAVA
eukprot:1161896-Pelagomonas_calceolata.AAC.7